TLLEPLTLNMNDKNDQDIEIEILNNQNIEPKVSNNQSLEPEMLNNQDVELEVLAAYDKELFVGKAFKNWNQVADFMKKYAIVKGHGIRISDGGRVNAKTKEILKWTYLYRYAGKPAKSSEHVGHELNPLASQFDPTLRKLPKNIVEEIRFLTTVAKADATMQKHIERYRSFCINLQAWSTISVDNPMVSDSYKWSLLKRGKVDSVPRLMLERNANAACLEESRLWDYNYDKLDGLKKGKNGLFI
ncbi:7391_t:CDS:2, partial [Gigaspora rosea]